ncbi:hypothetical protein C8J56DRAFT_167896 [Mycena floridula]|nr:hypothetical protein C8J56DRAFT_167896 [Mycena floridula]
MDDNEVLDWDEDDDQLNVAGAVVVDAGDDCDDAVSLGPDDDDDEEERASQPALLHTAETNGNSSKRAPSPVSTPKSTSFSQSQRENSQNPISNKPLSSSSRRQLIPLPPKPVVPTLPFLPPSHPSLTAATAMSRREISKAKSSSTVSTTVTTKPVSSAEPAETAASNSALPPNWEARQSREGNETYYYNKVTSESTWDRPTLASEPVVSPSAAAPGSKSGLSRGDRYYRPRGDSPTEESKPGKRQSGTDTWFANSSPPGSPRSRDRSHSPMRDSSRRPSQRSSARVPKERGRDAGRDSRSPGRPSSQTEPPASSKQGSRRQHRQSHPDRDSPEREKSRTSNSIRESRTREPRERQNQINNSSSSTLIRLMNHHPTFPPLVFDEKLLPRKGNSSCFSRGRAAMRHRPSPYSSCTDSTTSWTFPLLYPSFLFSLSRYPCPLSTF